LRRQPGEHLVGIPVFQPGEVLVVPLDEPRRLGRGPALGPPPREVAWAVVLARGAVDARGVGPDPEVADVQHLVEHHARDGLEREQVGVEPIEGSVGVASGAQQPLEARARS
jgi:hypothetical protein